MLPRLLVVFMALCASGLAAQKPNILFIMADDLGWSDTSNTLTNLGNPSSFFETPTIDRLATEGMAFTNAYTNGPNCAPTRSALLTGQYAPRPNNNVYLVGSLNRGGNATLLRGPPQGMVVGTGRIHQIPGSAFTVAEMFARGGYVSAHLGKYHSGGVVATNTPTAQGFAVNYGGGSAGGPGAYHASGGRFGGNIGPGLDPFAANYTQAYVDNNIKPFSKGVDVKVLNALVGTAKHVTDATVDAAISFMQANKSKPFYVQYHPYAVHSPIGNSQARSDLLTKYLAKKPVDDDGDGPEIPSYAALIEGLDQSIARLLQYLESTADPRNTGKKLADNTLVIFYSDNGGKQKQTYVGPLKGQKGELDEGGIRVPMIAWSKNAVLVDAKKINHTPVIGIDFYRTFADYAKVDTSSLGLDGESLVKLFANASHTLKRQSIFWHLPGYLVGGGRNQRPQSVIRKGKWKLFYNYEDATWELYDLVADIGEKTNMAKTQTATRDELALELRCWLADVKAPMPSFRNATKYADGKLYAAGANVPLPILPGNAVLQVGQPCSAVPCLQCTATLWFGNGNAALGNSIFTIDGAQLPAGALTMTAIGLGGCGPGVSIPSLCGKVHVPFALTPPVVVTAPSKGGSSGCTGTCQVLAPIPATTSLCGLKLSTQILGVCGSGGSGTVLTRCTTFHVLPN